MGYTQRCGIPRVDLIGASAMAQKRLIQISDLHLSRTRAYTYPNWKAILKWVNQIQPDLVVNTGDFIFEAPDD
ncbi:MAG: metallophosphoesterase, partial [Anaerolineae bacterium]|nr:metallophosphoesterase [Anaerolineae bacterium]